MFKVDREKIPQLKISKSILDMYDENFVTYEADGVSFESPQDENLEKIEREIYALIAWYERVAAKS